MKNLKWVALISLVFAIVCAIIAAVLFDAGEAHKHLANALTGFAIISSAAGILCGLIFLSEEC